MYCQRTDLTDYLLEAYLTAADEQTPGIVDKSIANVGREIDDALRARFVLPLSEVPGTLTRIAAVIAAYRIVGSITSMMASEGGSSNEWIPLQTQYKQAVKELELIRTGSLNIGLVELGEAPRNDDDMVVITRPKTFDLRGF